jgi:hypothetical protein
MSSAIHARNRLAKALPESWRRHLIDLGVPKRKYIAVCRATLADGRVIDPVIIEQGWIISVSRGQMAGQFEQRIDFDPRTITSLEVIQVA